MDTHIPRRVANDGSINLTTVRPDNNIIQKLSDPAVIHRGNALKYFQDNANRYKQASCSMLFKWPSVSTNIKTNHSVC